MTACSRRQLWALVPWDPAAPFVLYRKHQQVYAQLQEQAFQRRLFTEDQPAPPSQLREGRTLLQVRAWGPAAAHTGDSVCCFSGTLLSLGLPAPAHAPAWS